MSCKQRQKPGWEWRQFEPLPDKTYFAYLSVIHNLQSCNIAQSQGTELGSDNSEGVL